MRKDIVVIPNSKKSEVLEGTILKVKTKSQPENNKANLDVEKLLSEHFGREVKIVKGFKTRRKIVEVG